MKSLFILVEHLGNNTSNKERAITPENSTLIKYRNTPTKWLRFEKHNIIGKQYAKLFFFALVDCIYYL